MAIWSGRPHRIGSRHDNSNWSVRSFPPHPAIQPRSGSAFIAAILTIIGYSINDTVIIFDRIRENIGLHPRKSLKQNINDGLNQTLMRTINTSGTTLLVLVMIGLFGGEVIRGFVFALFMGIFIGTYSSVFNASPIVYDLLGGPKQEEEAARQAEEKQNRKK